MSTMVKVSYKLDDQRLRKLVATVRPRLEDVLKKAAFDVERRAKETAPVRTGALKNSIKTDLSRLSALEAEVGASVEYAIFVEFGTSRMAGRPFLTPALEAVKAEFMAAISLIFREAA